MLPSAWHPFPFLVCSRNTASPSRFTCHPLWEIVPISSAPSIILPLPPAYPTLTSAPQSPTDALGRCVLGTVITAGETLPEANRFCLKGPRARDTCRIAHRRHPGPCRAAAAASFLLVASAGQGSGGSGWGFQTGWSGSCCHAAAAPAAGVGGARRTCPRPAPSLMCPRSVSRVSLCPSLASPRFHVPTAARLRVWDSRRRQG